LEGYTTEPTLKAKTSKIAFASLLLMIIGFFVPTIRIATLLLTLAVVSGIAAIVKIKRSNGRLTGRWIAILSITVSAILFLIAGVFCLLSLDAPPIPDDYTIADLRSAGPEYADSFKLLMMLADEEGADPNSGAAAGLSSHDVAVIENAYRTFFTDNHVNVSEISKEKAQSINRAWENAKKGRDIIDALGAFEEIADLTEPDILGELTSFYSLKYLADLYTTYACMKQSTSSSKESVQELIVMDAVFRKLGTNTRRSDLKLICFLGLGKNIRAANFLLNDSRTSQESLELLAEHFKPLANEQVSCRNPIIFDYLESKKGLDEDIYKLLENDLAKRLRRSPIIKRNSTLKLSKNSCDYWINIDAGKDDWSALSIWPSSYPGWLPSIPPDWSKIPRYYFIYNPIGSLLVTVSTRSFERFVENKTSLRILDDLLQIVLNTRLGRGASMKARVYSDEYIIDVENKIIFSPGPDGESYTKDDIKLPINPEVLNLTQ